MDYSLLWKKPTCFKICYILDIPITRKYSYFFSHYGQRQLHEVELFIKPPRSRKLSEKVKKKNLQTNGSL